MSKRLFLPVAFGAVLALVMGLIVGAATVIAQESTPVIVEDTEANDQAEIELHPAHIHSGTCDDLGEVVYPLNDLQAAASIPDPDATPPIDLDATPDAAAATGLVDVASQSNTEVDVSLDDLLAGEFAINVHESPENIQNYIACGEITGTPDDGTLEIELQEVGISGFYGQAQLGDQGDGTTIVHLSLYPAEVDGEPVASPAS